MVDSEISNWPTPSIHMFFLLKLILAASTHDQDVFSFNPDETYCNGFEEVLSRYREIVPGLRLAG